MSQTTDLLAYFKEHKTILPHEAQTKLGIYRVADTVHKLRRTHLIETDMVEVRTRRGKTRVAQYHYVGPRKAA